MIIYPTDKAVEHLSAAEVHELRKEHNRFFNKKGVLKDPVGYIFSSPLLTFTNSWETSLCTYLVDFGIDSTKFVDVIYDIIFEEKPLNEILYAAKEECKTVRPWYGMFRKEYGSFADLCRASNIPTVLALSRLMRGWSYDKIFDMPVRVGSAETRFLANDMSKYTKNALGYTMQSVISFVLTCFSEQERQSLRGAHGELFTDISELCEYYRIDEARYQKMLAAGMNKSDILSNHGNAMSDDVFDLDDIKNYSFLRMVNPCLTRQDYIETAKKHKFSGKPEKIADWTGREFYNLREMCKCYCISESEFNRRRELGWDLPSTLLLNDKNSRRCVKGKFIFHKNDCHDHLGILYPSKKSMCTFWGVDAWYVQNRLSRGATLQECLTGTADRRLRLAGKV